MKVLQINAVYGHGSTGTIVRDIEYLCFMNNIECIVASPDPAVRHAKDSYLIGNIIDHKYHAFMSRLFGKQAYYSRRATKNLLKFIDYRKPDIVHLHNLHSNYINLNALLDYLAKNDIVTVITLHDCWFFTGGCFHYSNAGCYKWMESCGNCPKQMFDTPAFLKDCSSMILADRKKYILAIPHLYLTGVSHWITNEANKSFMKNLPIYVIPNGIDRNVFRPRPSNLRERLGLQDKFVILGPANKWLSPINKDVLATFIKLMKGDEVLLLFGTSKISKPLNNVVYFGFTKDRMELAELYSMADVFVNCSREDSLSLINIEAQACGTPVVTFDRTGPKETVDNIVSHSVPVGDVYMLYSNIQLIRGNINESEERDIVQFIEEKYDGSKNYKEYIKLYINSYGRS